MSPSYSFAAEPRSKWAAASEIIIMSVIFIAAALMMIASPLGQTKLEVAWQRAVTAGIAVSEHIDSALGAYASIFLAFYGVVIGGQLSRSPKALRTQRFLGFTSEVIVAALMPAIVLIVIKCVEHPSNAGALFVLIPLTAFLLAVATILGTFHVFSTSEQRESLTVELRQIEQRRGSLSRPSKYGFVVIVAHVIIVVLVAVVITEAVNNWTIGIEDITILSVSYLVTAGLLAGVSVYALVSWQSSPDPIGKAAPTIFMLILYVSSAVLIVSFALENVWSVAVSLAVILLATVLSTYQRLSRLVNVSLHGVATNFSIGSLSKQRKRIDKRLRDLPNTAS